MIHRRDTTAMTIVADTQHTLWLQFADGSWLYADLAEYAETHLSDPIIFIQARLDVPAQTIGWPDGTRLPTADLRLPTGYLFPHGVLVRERESHPRGWYRPLLPQPPLNGYATWEAQPSELSMRRLLDTLQLDPPALTQLLEHYRAAEEHVLARLLDLIEVLDTTGPTSAHDDLHRPWPLGQHTHDPHLRTPADAILHGHLATVEAILTTRATQGGAQSAPTPPLPTPTPPSTP
ncbi:hypothetical protein [Deinococcus pimensis]|uniref:hypothetical protein n=1 Tax=Deinococcus pimensis TaxID=309888 RepID=UPI0004833535|nr:hypothetical protein [Deinococcus pimensis]